MSDFRIIETGVMRECAICTYTGTATDHIGQCPNCGWDELQPATIAQALDAALSMIEVSLTGLTNPDTGRPYNKGVDDLALTPDGSMTLLKARAILAKARGQS